MWKKHQARCRGFAIIECADLKTYKSILDHKVHFFSGRNIECKQFVASKDKLQNQNQLQMDRKIFVGCISEHATNEELRRCFSKIGEVEISYIIQKTPKKCPMNRVFGYVSFKDKESRDRAIKIRNLVLADTIITCLEYNAKFQHRELEEGFLMNQTLLKDSNHSESSFMLSPPLLYLSPDARIRNFLHIDQPSSNLLSHLQIQPNNFQQTPKISHLICLRLPTAQHNPHPHNQETPSGPSDPKLHRRDLRSVKELILQTSRTFKHL